MFVGRVVEECPARTIEQFDQQHFTSVATLSRSGRQHRDVPRHLGKSSDLICNTRDNQPLTVLWVYIVCFMFSRQNKTMFTF